jgi:two-component system sensor histidine kinase YesM
MIRFFMNRSIKTKIVWISLIISTIPLAVVAALFYKTSTDSLERTMYQSSSLNAEYLSEYINKYFSSLSNSALQIYGFERIMNMMKSGYNSQNADYMNLMDDLASYYRLIESQNTDVFKILLFGKDNKLADSWSRASIYDRIKGIKETPDFQQLLNLQFQHTFMFTYDDKEFEANFFVYGIPIYNPFYKDKIGTIVFYINSKDIRKMIEKYNVGPNVILLQNANGEIFYHTNGDFDQEVGKYSVRTFPISKITNELHFNDRQDLLIDTSFLDHGNIQLNIVYPNTELAKNRQRILNITLVTVAVVLLFIALFSLLSQQIITKPIRLLGKTMKKVRNGNFNVSLKTNEWRDDITDLIRNFNYMVDKIRELIESEYDLQLRNKEAQIIALQTQINPHFLYNTLQTIGGKAVLIGEYEIHEMCRALGDVFRYSFYKGNMESTLGMELLHINNYLYIQKVRFEDSLQIEIDVEEELRDCPIIRFVLQPVIENMIVHALGKNEDQHLHIRLSAERRNDKVMIRIEDDGPGIESSRLLEINEFLEQKSFAVFEGVSIGLKNVHERLRLAYGPEFGIQIRSVYGQGTTVEIWIPYRKGKHEHV